MATGKIMLGDSVTYLNTEHSIKSIKVTNEDGLIRIYINDQLKHIQGESKGKNNEGDQR